MENLSTRQSEQTKKEKIIPQEISDSDDQNRIKMGEDKLGGCLYEEGYDKRLSFE